MSSRTKYARNGIPAREQFISKINPFVTWLDWLVPPALYWQRKQTGYVLLLVWTFFMTDLFWFPLTIPISYTEPKGTSGPLTAQALFLGPYLTLDWPIRFKLYFFQSLIIPHLDEVFNRTVLLYVFISFLVEVSLSTGMPMFWHSMGVSEALLYQ